MTTEATEKKNYKATLNLPQTAFPMEAKLTANEPSRLARWKSTHLYEVLLAQNAKKPKWILHDGPPFANGDIHIGHLINKTLKDVVVRFRTMQGYQTPYVPGWDCHGLPIEHKIQQDLGPKLRQMNVVEVRKLCQEYARKYVKVQSEQFQRLGILGDWENPYLTMAPKYEAEVIEVFAKFVEAGLVYKQLKPVPWSIENQTALADAELEYQDVTDKSVYVEFPLTPLTPSPGTPGEGGGEGQFLLVWTTTPWTLPANLAVSVHPEVQYSYVQVEVNGSTRTLVIATDLVEKVLATQPAARFVSTIKQVSGKELTQLKYHHPFLEREGRIVPALYVTTTDGTGLVHTAPGHGEDDYLTGVAEKLEVYCPVLANGRFDDTAPQWLTGKSVWESNAVITKHLSELGLLFAEQTITHSYPHDWRSKKPIIFRATEQWFISTSKPFSVGDGSKSLRQRALEAASRQIEFVPKWGQARMVGMLESRPDWCISRQRAWGLPIPVFYNDKGDGLLTAQSVRAVAKRFADKGSDCWFTDSPGELLGADFRYPPGFSPENLRKEKDIFDVWFESGSSWHAVLQARADLHFPADLYLEGSDQHRGWFQLSLLPSLGATGKPPFKQVLTHGFVVKPDGTKVSKSDKEYVTATQEINRHGADLLRLWCCSVDYQNDIPASPAAIQEFGDKYRKIRNTLRYLVSNLYDFDPAANAVNVPANSLDGWARNELNQLIAEVSEAYDKYQLHRAFRLLHDFCAVQISAVYGNAMKDRLYCDSPASPLRRRCQTVMRETAAALIRLMAPMLVFTADEAWEYLPHKSAEEAAVVSVHLLELPRPVAQLVSEGQVNEWKRLMDLREQALGQLDALKKSAGMNKALEAELVYKVDEATKKMLEPYGVDLEDMVGAGFHSFVAGSGGPSLEVVDRRQTYKACARSWKRRPDVGSDAQYPDLSARDAAAVRGAEAK